MEEYVFFDNPQYDDAIIGSTTDGRVVYSYELIADSLVTQKICDNYNEALEFIDVNIFPSLSYCSNSPIIIYTEDFELESLMEERFNKRNLK